MPRLAGTVAGQGEAVAWVPHLLWRQIAPAELMGEHPGFGRVHVCLMLSAALADKLTRGSYLSSSVVAWWPMG